MQRFGLFLMLALALLACAETDDGGGKKGSTGNGGDGGSFTTATTTTDGAGGGSTTTSSTGGSSGCVHHWDCPAADEICVAGGCDLAWGRQFCFNGMSANANGTDPNTGEAWDPLGGAPDPYVEMFVNEMPPPIHTTATVDDTFTPSWPEEFCLVFDEPATTIGFYVSDEDVGSPTYMTLGATGTETEWIALVRSQMLQGTLVTTGTAGTFTVHVEPL